MLLALTLSATLCCTGQSDSRWRLLPDSMVLVPYHELLDAAANRATVNALHRHDRHKVVALASEALALRKALDAERLATEATRKEADMCRSKYRDCTDDLIRQAHRARKPNLQGILLGAGIGLVTGALLFTLAP
jgi:ElaB/YqjD/DUF883 family membrane-anchored ribosome-binding protein